MARHRSVYRFHSTRTASSSAPMVSGQRFPGGWVRPVFGLWAAYFVAASHLDQDSALACAVQHFVPITAAGQRRNYTGFPFNRPLCRGLTCTSVSYTAKRLAWPSPGSQRRIWFALSLTPEQGLSSFDPCVIAKLPIQARQARTRLHPENMCRRIVWSTPLSKRESTSEAQ